MAFQNVLTDMLKKEFDKIGLHPVVSSTVNEIVIRITKEEIIDNFKKGIPPQLSNSITVEASDIVIKVRIT
jgi:hypothetical protein